MIAGVYKGGATDSSGQLCKVAHVKLSKCVLRRHTRARLELMPLLTATFLFQDCSCLDRGRRVGTYTMCVTVGCCMILTSTCLSHYDRMMYATQSRAKLVLRGVAFHLKTYLQLVPITSFGQCKHWLQDFDCGRSHSSSVL